jgi:hypothetical protein
MKPALKNILSIGMLLFLGFHFTLILNYAAPVKADGKLNAASVFYCYPYFHQQWTVFVPAPKKQFNLYMRAGKDGDWQPWFSVNGELVCKNKRIPAFGAEPEALLVTNAMNYLYGDLDKGLEKGNTIYKDRPSFPSFAIIERAAKRYFHHSPRSKKEKEFELLFTAISAEGKMQAWYFKNLAPL